MKSQEFDDNVIRSAEKTGAIIIPAGTAEEIESWRRAIARLEKLGYVSRITATSYYGPVYLTESGKAFRDGLLPLDHN